MAVEIVAPESPEQTPIFGRGLVHTSRGGALTICVLDARGLELPVHLLRESRWGATDYALRL